MSQPENKQHGKPQAGKGPEKWHEIIKKSREKHGHGEAGDRVHLEEMLSDPDVPEFLRSQMQLAHNRHIQREQLIRRQS